MTTLFQEQIQARLINDEEALQEAFVDLSAAITGTKPLYRGSDSRRIEDAAGEILAFFKLPAVSLPEDIEDKDGQIAYIIQASGLLKRQVSLSGAWYRDCTGPLLAEKNGAATALIPRFFSGYRYFDAEKGRTVKVTKRNASLFGSGALSFFKPLPRRRMDAGDMAGYMAAHFSTADICFFCLASLACALLGLFPPALTEFLFGSVVPARLPGALLSTVCFLIGAAVPLFLFSLCKRMLLNRITTKVLSPLQAAIVARVFSLSPRFFRGYSTGALAERLSALNNLCTLLSSTLVSLVVTALFSFLYLFQIASYAAALLLPALGVLGLNLILTLLFVLRQSKRQALIMKHSAEANGFVYELLNGIQKIKLVGGEKRAFASWAKKYGAGAKYTFAPPFIITIFAPLKMAFMGLGTILIFVLAGKSGMPPERFFAFNTAYSMFCAAVLAFSDMAPQLAGIGPALDFFRPILEAEPEASPQRQRVSRLSGAIELNNVSFRYGQAMPLVLDNLSMKIRRGEYVAVVGKTGCGKSTLLRLLLGFETPLMGSVYYDGKDLEKLDVQSVRNHIGVVMQNGKLFAGSIYDNITVSAPGLGMDDAWAAAEIAGLAEDIRALPMGMFTMISEGGGGFSGGQKQRLLIARAVAAKPRIIFFDEATSALDNITQKHVSDALDSFKSTRLVIAHRLSTIRRCDRIIVLDAGHIAEEGAYDELISRRGIFADLVARQRLDGH